MSEATLLITGATGLIGGHIAARARQEGFVPCALVRPSSPGRDQLAAWGVRSVVGDLLDPQALATATKGASFVVHCAARVGDWGAAGEYHETNVVATRRLLEAVAGVPSLQGFIHLSSLGVYPPRHHDFTDEEQALGLHGLDAYTRTKAESERLVCSYAARGMPITVLRPGFVYGPHDRHVLPVLADALRRRRFCYLGSGLRLLDNTAVRNIGDAVFLALRNEAARGNVYNITDARLVTRREYVETVAMGLGLPLPTRQIPERVAYHLAYTVDKLSHLVRKKQAPVLSLARYKFLALDLKYSIDKARRELGYTGHVDFQDGMQEALAWYKAARSTVS